MNFSLPNMYGSLNIGPSGSGLPPIMPSLGPQASQPAGAVKKNCNCKNSRCLKLYCECFSSGEYCKNCNCNGCCNNIENESIRKKTIAEVLERNPNAFRPKIAATPASPMVVAGGPSGPQTIGSSLIGATSGSLNINNIAIDAGATIPIN